MNFMLASVPGLIVLSHSASNCLRAVGFIGCSISAWLQTTARPLWHCACTHQCSILTKCATACVLCCVGDGLVAAHIVHSDDDDVVVASKQGVVVRCAAKDVRALGRTAKGVRLMSLQADDEVQTLAVVPNEYKTALA